MLMLDLHAHDACKVEKNQSRVHGRVQQSVCMLDMNALA